MRLQKQHNIKKEVAFLFYELINKNIKNFSNLDFHNRLYVTNIV